MRTYLCTSHYAPDGNGLLILLTTYLEAKAVNDSLGPRPFAMMIVEELCAVHVLAEAWAEASTYTMQELGSREGSIQSHRGLTFW